MGPIVIIDYDSTWPRDFILLRSRVWPAVQRLAHSIEHVGSTSVEGLAAKPVIDISIVVPTDGEVSAAIESLALVGYHHRGDLGVPGREAFEQPDDLPRHHLYLCPAGSPALHNHLALRDYLRATPAAAREYGALKKRLAEQFPYDIDAYVEGKTDFIVSILRACDISPDSLQQIERANRTSS